MVIQSHIGVLAFPFGTHATPLLSLVQQLANSTTGIQFSFFNSSSSNETIFSTYVLETFDNIRPHEVWDGKPDGQAFSGTHLEKVQLFLNVSPMNYEKAIEEAETETGLKICCLLTDAFLWFGCDLAEKRGVPWVAFWTSASCSLSIHLHTDLIQDAVEHKGATTMEQKLSFIPGMSVANFSDVAPEIFRTKNPTSLAITIHKMVEKIPKSTAVVLNSFEEIDPIITEDLKSKLQHFLNVGPLILSSPTPLGSITDQENDCLSWLQHQKGPKSVVYISFGSVAVPPGYELTALAEALETCKFSFLWSLRHHAMKLLPEGFQDRTREFGKMVSWAPQLQVLAHCSVGVFVTHCGWNSILESVCNGVPMICRPFFGDQKLNSRMIEDSWKIDLRVKGGVFTKNETTEALECIMSSEAGEALRENLNKLKDIAKNAVGSGGSSSKNFSTLLEIISGAKGNDS
ncbi:anthocyanidin 3-O-glucosyltransferase-like [Primulina huaijiensis]|uniref:anthocyanidin 3-O-glucosyltransferase-like n=1 Tax=Primulina huaijiensis TaxID=1492673 RepID=UPI003CC74AA3